MVDGILDLVPSARVGHVGMYRDPETHEPHQYYCKFPPDVDKRTCLIVDPMLATGGSMTAAIQFLREAGVKDIRALTLVSAPEGVHAVLDTTRMCASTPARSTASSTRMPTSCRAWAMRETASTARSNSVPTGGVSCF